MIEVDSPPNAIFCVVCDFFVELCHLCRFAPFVLFCVATQKQDVGTRTFSHIFVSSASFCVIYVKLCVVCVNLHQLCCSVSSGGDSISITALVPPFQTFRVSSCKIPDFYLSTVGLEWLQVSRVGRI